MTPPLIQTPHCDKLHGEHGLHVLGHASDEHVSEQQDIFSEVQDSVHDVVHDFLPQLLLPNSTSAPKPT